MNPARPKVGADEEAAAPVTILDGMGQVIRTIPASEFRRTHGSAAQPTAVKRRQRRLEGESSEVAQTAVPG